MTPQERKAAVEWHLKNWRRLQEEVWAAERDAENIAFSQGSGEPVQSSSISDKTARGAFLLDGIAEKRRWVEVITEAMRRMRTEHPDLQRLLYGHYWMDHLKGYRRAHAKSFTESYCTVYHISVSEYKERRKDALWAVTFEAAEAGLFKTVLDDKKPW